MAIMLDVRAQLDEASLAEISARIRTAVRESVLAGIADALASIGNQPVVNIGTFVVDRPEFGDFNPDRP